ncbi:hypothetical protein [Antiquaquibacter soli]|uniref:LPXTG cell wall anchor domain-containing protein n=1 Tax=Antiquaquibacter soli TaxID=3064523 RepID=A0ABT9BQT2_9MICO|nr:hypothetical protein [Protaetiibacter sp. WY-16]MDO7883304.1 hypothetical protein [Protaetiibacter sp. WY-16]
MKKTIAALGASVLGLGSAVAVGAAPANAEPAPVTDCANIEEQIGSLGSSNDPAEMWFENCIPQYGLGKVEFTIVPDEDNPAVDFPEDFVTLDDAAYEDSPITVTTTTDAAALQAYFGAEDAPYSIAPILPQTILDEESNSQTYGATVIAKISSLTAADPETVPADVVSLCEYDELDFGGYVASYDPIDTTFTQTVDGAEWTYTITGQSPDSYFLITTVDEVPFLCITDGENAAWGPLSSGGYIYLGVVLPFIPETFSGPTSFEQSADASASEIRELLDGTIEPAAIGDSGLYTLGVFERLGVPAPGPALAATGSDGNALILPAIIVGGVVVLGGALIAVSVIRRRRTNPATETVAPAESSAPPTDPAV